MFSNLLPRRTATSRDVRPFGVVTLFGALLVAVGVSGGPTLAAAQSQGDISVAVPSKPGPVDGTSQNSDEFIWNLITQFAAPVDGAQGAPTFETWASDANTFTANPQWPGPTVTHDFTASRLGLHANPTLGPIDVSCSPPPNPAVGTFPLTGTPTPCIAEEVKRNRPQFDYIVDNKLYTKAGIAAAFASSFQMDMPASAIAVKGDWVPVATLMQWIPDLAGKNIGDLYVTTTDNGTEYGLVAMHISSKQNKNWVWGTLEHQMIPGRCDTMGCFDTFGAQQSAVAPNRAQPNTQYGACEKTPALQQLMTAAHLSPAWANYCLKGTEVDFTAPDGTPYALGNTVVEGINANVSVAGASCITCHAYASYGSGGTPTASALAMLAYNAQGKVVPGTLDNARQYDFMWGLLAAP